MLLVLSLPLWGQAPLQIRVVEGNGVAYTVGSRATRGVTVEVRDTSGIPVAGARVRFELPATGPTGTFSSGDRTTLETTDAQGRAQVWGMQWNRVAGPLEIRISASKGAFIANLNVGLSLTNAAAPVAVGSAAPSRSHKKLWIVLAVAGAAGAAVVGVAGKSSPASSATPVNPPRIGTPTITIGQP